MSAARTLAGRTPAVALIHGDYLYQAYITGRDRVVMGRRHIDRFFPSEHGALGTWAGAIVPEDSSAHWPRQAIDRLGGMLRDQIEDDGR